MVSQPPNTKSGFRGSPVYVPKIAEVIAEGIRRQIVRQELVEGDTLPPEAELLEQFGISRPTLREAFRILSLKVF